MTIFCDARLAHRLDEALTREGAAYLDAWLRLYPGSGAAKLWVAGGCAVFAGVDSPLTQAIGLGREGPVTTSDLDRVEAFFRERGALPRINLQPFAHPSLVRALGERGYGPEEFENAMVRPLAAADRFAVAAPGVAVRETDSLEAHLWGPLIARAFLGEEPGHEPPSADVMLARASLDISGSTAFLGEVGGVPAGGGCLVVHDGLATLFGDATLPEWRGHGVQSALLAARLSRAVESGCSLATAGSTPGSGSQRNMERLGFRVAYTQVMMAAVP